jgi:hypothetical protein
MGFWPDGVQQRHCPTFKGVPARDCMPRKTPLQQSANNQHKAKIEPGKSFFKSEPRSEVKFHKKPGSVLGIRLNSKARFLNSLRVK